ncbi:MAG: extracellular solute-binding protein [Acidobacteriota bacterium]|nr:extracellular solute-binding protein [Acidobacteriota bacterium]
MAKLRIAIRNYADFTAALGEEALAFELMNPSHRVEVVPMGIHELYDAALTKGGLRDGTFDIALLVTDWLAEGIQGDSLEDLAAWNRHAPIYEWPEAWAHTLVDPLMFGEKQAALPWHDGPECLVYRADLFEEAKTQKAFRKQFGRDLAPPTTWAQLEETARFFTNAASNLYGTVFAGFPDGHNTLYDFALQVWSRGGELVDGEGVPKLDSQEAQAGLEYYRRVVRDTSACHPSSPDLDSTQSGDKFMAGEVAMMANWFGFAARAGRPGSALARKVAIAPIPTDGVHEPVSLSVFWALAIGTGSANKETAWQFLRFTTEPHRDLARTHHGTVGVRLSTWREPSLQIRIPAYREIERISLGARQLPRGERMAEFATIVDNVMSRALKTDDSSQAILADAQKESMEKGLKFS